MSSGSWEYCAGAKVILGLGCFEDNLLGEKERSEMLRKHLCRCQECQLKVVVSQEVRPATEEEVQVQH
jgi:hypothetical protein